jgi:hypothetical protein
MLSAVYAVVKGRLLADHRVRVEPAYGSLSVPAVLERPLATVRHGAPLTPIVPRLGDEGQCTRYVQDEFL